MDTDFEKNLRQFQEHARYVDELAQAVLKGHLIIEEALTRVIEKFLFHPEHLEDCKLRFYQKVQLARALCLRKNKLGIWNLILAINSLRNQLAHSLDSSERKKKTEQVKLLYFEEATGIEELNEHKDKADHVIVHFACVLCAGFLASFEADATAFRSLVDSMDSILNPGKQEGESPQSP